MAFFAPSTWAGKPLDATIPKCGACGLFRACKSPKMPVTGRGRHKVLFVGEAPGEQEDARGEQLIGPAGQQLRNMMPPGVGLDDCWKTNSIICFKGDVKGNEIEDAHIEYCRPNLLNTIKALKPNVIVLLGLSAVKSLIGTEWGDDIGSMKRWAGWAIPSARYGAWVCPTFHPSYVLRTNSDPPLVRMVEDHLAKAVSLEHVPVPRFDTDAFGAELITDPRRAKMRLKDLARKRGVLAFDYETTGLKPERQEQRIVSASFCLDGVDTFACLIDPSLHPWLGRVLLNERLRKVASNLKFEERWTRAKLGHPVAGWEWDTMLAAHAIDNRKQITSVKFQTYVHLGVGGYAGWVKRLREENSNGLNGIDRIHPHDLLSYNATDAIVEYEIMLRQKEMLKWSASGDPS